MPRVSNITTLQATSNNGCRCGCATLGCSAKCLSREDSDANLPKSCCGARLSRDHVFGCGLRADGHADGGSTPSAGDCGRPNLQRSSGLLNDSSCGERS